MNIVERIRNHPLFPLAALLIPIIGGVWFLLKTFLVDPKKEHIEFQDRIIAALKDQVAAQERQILTLKEQVAKPPGILSQTKPDSLETSPQKSAPVSQMSKQEPTSSDLPSQKKDALNSPLQTRFDGIVVNIIRFEKTEGLVVLQLMARNTTGPRRTVCFYPRMTNLIHEATGQSWQPKEFTGQECTQLETGKFSHIWMRFDVAEPENKIFSLSSLLFNETLDNLVLAKSP